MTDGINYDAFSEALNDKADRDLQNVDTVSGGDAVIAFQRPTAENGYTWYRKYASGWVEQGGIEMASGAIVTLPIAMADTKYTVQATPTWGMAISSGTRGLANYSKTTTSFAAQVDNNSGYWDWQVSGMAAQ